MNLRKRIFYRIGKLTGILPHPVHSALWRGLRLAKRQPLARLTGITHAGVRGSMIMAGDPRELEFVLEKFFASAPERVELGRGPFWTLPRRLRALRPTASLTVAILDRLAGGVLGREGYLMTGELVRTVTDSVPRVPALAVGNASLRHDVQRMKREGFGCVLSKDPADLELFYRDMLKPHVEARFGDTAPGLDEIRHAFDHGVLMWIVKGDERVAGTVLQLRRDRLLLRGFGVARGDSTLLRRGALAAAYIHAIEHASERGLAVVDFGGSRPWLDDGVLRYKMKWRPRIDPRWMSSSAVYFRWPDGDPSVEAMFRARALICRRDGGFAFVCASGAWPPLTAPVRPGEWPVENAISPDWRSHEPRILGGRRRGAREKP